MVLAVYVIEVARETTFGKKLTADVGGAMYGVPIFPSGAASSAQASKRDDRPLCLDSSEIGDKPKRLELTQKLNRRVSEFLMQEAMKWNQRPDARDRIIASYLLYVGVLAGVPPEPDDTDANCNDECRQNVSQLRGSAKMKESGAIDTMARIASSTDDPAAYVLAFKLCSFTLNEKDQGSCSLLSAARWAQMEPDNAAAWFAAAREAGRRGDIAERDQDVFRAAHAISNDDHSTVLGSVMQSTDFEVQPDDLQIATAYTLMGSRMGLFRLGSSTALDYCGGSPTADPNRAQVCSTLVSVLADHPNDIFDLLIASKVAESIDLPNERKRELRDRFDAYSGLNWKVMISDSGDPLSCEAMHANGKWIQDNLLEGEIASIQAKLKASGKSLEELAEIGRTERKQWMAAVKENEKANGGTP